LSDIAVAFIAFSMGEFFTLSTLKKNGIRVVLIALLDTVLAAALVFILSYFVLRLGLAISVVLAALASATAPASTVMTIRQTGAKGDFVDTLMQVIALDDLISLLAYSVAISIALTSLSTDAVSFATVIKPLLVNLGVLLLGCLFGIFLKLLFRGRSNDNRLIVSIAMLFAFCGVCTILGISPLLGCMSMGMVYINTTNDTKLFKQLAYFSPPILLLFFVRSGLNFNLGALFSGGSAAGSTPLIVVSVLYFLVRMVGKYAGAFLGCGAVKKPAKIRNYLGLALFPLAGVAVGLASLAARTLGGTVGSELQTIIVAACILYEIAGPACAKLALWLSGSYSHTLEALTEVEPIAEDNTQKSEVEILIERINKIREEIPAHERSPIEEEEDAFTEAAMEEREWSGMPPRGRLARRR
ncbi:MAG: cation:proton antiporter, partial [Oscillospiraceae bacterium]|nr:cation:proton antiporter [Oscillospiraceae bacterium]